MKHKIAGIALLSGALILAGLILTDTGSHMGPGFPEEDLPSPAIIAAIIVGLIGTALLLGSRLELLTKTAR